METLQDLIVALGGQHHLARVFGVSQPAVAGMKRRGVIPADHWIALIAEAERQGITITAEDLLILNYGYGKKQRVT